MKQQPIILNQWSASGGPSAAETIVVPKKVILREVTIGLWAYYAAAAQNVAVIMYGLYRGTWTYLTIQGSDSDDLIATAGLVLVSNATFGVADSKFASFHPNLILNRGEVLTCATIVGAGSMYGQITCYCDPV